MQTTDYSGAIVPSIGSRVMHYVDYDIGTVVDRVEVAPEHWNVRVRWDSDPSWPLNHNPDELLDAPTPEPVTAAPKREDGSCPYCDQRSDVRCCFG